jgi:hypothetical protein
MLVLAAGLPIVAGLAKQQEEATSDSAETRPGEATATAPSPSPPVQPQPQATLQPQPQPQQPQGPQQWTQQNFGGTAWSIYVEQLRSNIVVQFNQGGSAMANTPMGPVQGNWNISGNRLNLTAMGQQVSCIIQGWRLYLPTGGQAQRVQ